MAPSTSPSPEPLQPQRYSSGVLPSGIWVLGFVSLFMDMSSELVHSLLPTYLTTVLGASMLSVGVIEGIAEATASVVKVVSGTASDLVRRRKGLVVLGYGLSALTKPIFPLASSVSWVFGARVLDRIGKGIRGAPRDALVADITPSALRGAAFGLRQALDTVGAIAGPLLAIVLMMRYANAVTSVLWVAVVPACIAVLLLIVAVREPAAHERQAEHPRTWRDTSRRLTLDAVRQLPSRYWLVVLLGAVFTLARFSEAFLLLRAQDLGVAVTFVPAVLMIMNVVYAAAAYPAGLLSDRMAARTLLVVGLIALIVADLLLAVATSIGAVVVGAMCWGLHMAFTQGLFAKLVADAAPAPLRGSAFGVFHLVSGGALLAASVIAGWLWSTFGAFATFVAGAGFAALTTVGLLLYYPRKAPHG